MLTPWQIFARVPNAEGIAAGLQEIPSHWSLTPLQEKKPRRKNWQTENFIPHITIKNLVLNGDEAISQKTGKPYTRFWSGFGLRLGEASGGLLAIDVDGASAQPILEAMSGGNIPHTVSWSSGKRDRYQLAFQIPENLRGKLQNFTREVITKWGNLETLKDENGKPLELLEFRYNRSQSALPPSLHPSTGSYHWVNSPANTEVALAPDWLCEILVQLADAERQTEEAKLEARRQREKAIAESQQKRKVLGIAGSLNLVDAFSQSIQRLAPEEIFNWSGHNFTQRGREWFGCCPNHQSQSGESFTVNPSSLDWYCYGCNVGGGVGEYRHFVKGGKGTPRGKDFYEITKELAAQAGIELPKPTEQQKGFSKDYRREAREHERQEKLRQERLKLEAEDAIYEKLTTIQEKPWKVINTPKINLEELLTEPGAIYIVSSAKGTHKTNALIPVVASYDRVLAWFSRVALGREECNRIGTTWKDDASSYSNKNKRGFCADSAFQFDPKILSDKGFLLGDECDQVFAHMFGSTCNKDGKRPLILATLEAHIDAAIHGGGMALFMSADVTQRDIDYLKALAPEGCPVRLIVNEYEPPRGIVFFDMSESPDGKIEELLMALEEGTPCFLIDDIKNGVRGGKSIAEYVRTVHPEWSSKIVEINSDTSGDPFIIDYLRNINEASKQTLLLACSPSVVSGISIENGHFGGVFALLNGILTVSDASQAIARVRGAEEINLWAAEEGLAYEANHSTDPDEIKDWYRRNYEANCKHMLSFRAEYEPITGEWASPHFDLFCKNTAYRNLCMSRLRERLQTRLIDEGYDVIIQEDAGSDMVKEALKDCWHKIELTEAYAIANANILSEAELEALQFKTTPLTPEEKLDLQKTLLLKWFGQELIDATTYEHDTGKILTGYAAMALKNERGVYRQRLENFYLLASDEGEAISKDIAAETSQLKHNHGRFPGDIRWRSRQRKARAWLGLPQFLNPEKWYEPADYRAMGQKAKSKAPMIKDCLNLTVDNISDGQVFGELMCQLGLELDKEWATVKPGQRRFKRRRISAESWKFAQMYVTYQEQIKAEREASTSTQLSHQGVCQSDHPPQNIYTDAFFRGGVITEESQVEQVEMLTQQLDGSIQLCDNAVYDSGCANLITPPSIYSEASFLGGGDQDLSQGVCQLLQGATTDSNPVADLVEAFPYCHTLESFAAVVEWYDDAVIADAIALQDSQPRRQQLWGWLEQLAQPEPTAVEKLPQATLTDSESLRDRLLNCVNIPAFKRIVDGLPLDELKLAIDSLPAADRDRVSHYWRELRRRESLTSASCQEESRLRSYGQMLLHGFERGIESFRQILSQWTVRDRWAAVTEFEELAPDQFAHLVQTTPDLWQWCG